ncbi:type III toxin-antitoxin system ToxN/AbiQ family toxin [uncultured Treponema sp.]|uniref:type III toxin-antitoxin system ToxN/AbiQ family toxin n=1 Tax=uncultured Treponema sp. TaxID=162155 RepID=UPI0025DA0452|nr:type III toxin-antitoxin system ToxN/AbiQ family toxin [uncultured Treponema sp.]
MFSLQDNLKFVNINQDYLQYLHDSCSEVYYKSVNYDTKPYLGILVTTENQEYVIPLSSAKTKHKNWKDVESDRFVIFEICSKNSVKAKDIFIDNQDGTVKHILSVIDLKKMIPIKSNLYTVVDLNPNKNDTNEITKYKVLMNLEYNFCLKIMNQIIQKATKLYEKQLKTGKLIPFCCDFKLLEERCKEWLETHTSNEK